MSERGVGEEVFVNNDDIQLCSQCLAIFIKIEEATRKWDKQKASEICFFFRLIAKEVIIFLRFGLLNCSILAYYILTQ